MPQPRNRLVPNVLWNWSSHILNIAVGFFILRFLIGRLGAEAFGTWVLLSAILSFYGLLNLGFDSSVVRFVSRYLAEGKREEVARILSTSQMFFAGLALLILLLGGGLGAAFAYSDFVYRSLFTIPAVLRSEFSLLLAVLSAGVAVTFLARVQVGVLRALDRWDLVNKVHIVILLTRTLAVVLWMGHSLLVLGCIFAVFNALHALLSIFLAVRLLPESRPRWGGWHADSGQKVGRYGLVAFLNQLADLFRYQTDAFVIGQLLSMELVAYYNFGYKLLEYLRHFIGNIGWPLFPVFSRYEGEGDEQAVRTTFLRASRVTAFLTFLAAGSLFGSGGLLLDLWVGSQIGPANLRLAEQIMLLLLLPFMLELIQTISTNLLFGVGRHHYLCLLHGCEGTANLLLSILLAPQLGLVGVALGTAIPMFASKLLFLPRYVCRYLKIPVGSYLLRVLAAPVLLALSLGGMQRLFYKMWSDPSWTALAIVIASTCGIFSALAWGVYFNSTERRFLLRYLRPSVPGRSE